VPFGADHTYDPEARPEAVKLTVVFTRTLWLAGAQTSVPGGVEMEAVGVGVPVGVGVMLPEGDGVGVSVGVGVTLSEGVGVGVSVGVGVTETDGAVISTVQAAWLPPQATVTVLKPGVA